MAKLVDKQSGRIGFCLCPNCFRAVPERLGERYCTNCGTLMLSACPSCRQPITSPEARFGGRCGKSLALEPKTW